MTDIELWSAPQSDGFTASINLPGSKSLTNRELVLSALAIDETTLLKPLISRDSALMITALTALGTEFTWSGKDLLVTPNELTGPANIDCGLAGTVMRFVPPVAMLAKGEVFFDGDEGARNRPMGTTVESLRALGAKVTTTTGNLPFSVTGTGSVPGGSLEIDASASSQFVSGLLLGAPRFDEGLVLTHRGASLPSLPHIEMTLETLRHRGVQAQTLSDSSWQVLPGSISGGQVAIEPDLSNAGPFMAAAMVSAGTLIIPNWPATTTQVGDHYRIILQRMGAHIEVQNGSLTISGTGDIKGIEIDLGAAGELTPTVAALAALASTPSRLNGIGHLRGHETDRLKALVAEINNLGGNAKELEDGIEITPATLSAGTWRTYHDHRMATSGAIIGLRVPGIKVENIATTSKTMPDFANMWHEMLGS
ncbi:MAG: 3-phosphoshikimate 1-carboxyvinyltransferase [Aquiluna sp.]|nr:3-phosphoshikimate 1-carboxyvinyltransferase [Aquiluna sp.]